MRLTSPSLLQALLLKHEFNHKRQWGQNFLIDENLLQKMVQAAGMDGSTLVLEVGSGAGTLTQALCEKAKKVVSVEIDQRLAPILQETLAEYDNHIQLFEDVMHLDFAQLVQTHFDAKPFQLVANLPYCITSPLLMKFFEEKMPDGSRIPLSVATVMVQKEAADRLCAVPGGKEYGALSLIMQYYAEAKILFKVPKTVFMPQPKVESVVLRLVVRDEPLVKDVDEKFLMKTIHAGFAMRRKTLENNLCSAFLLDRAQVKAILRAADLPESIRGEQLNLQAYAKLSRVVQPFCE